MSNKAPYQLALECMRRSESCLYTSTSFFGWIRFLRWMKVLFAIVPLILGSLAGWNILVSSSINSIQYFTAISSFLAGLLPSVYLALKLDDHLESGKHLASEFKNLQDAYRQAALVSRHKPFEQFETEVNALNNRLEKARVESMTPPEIFFKIARWKIKAGDYSFDVDED